jgi:hypothetical protein
MPLDKPSEQKFAPTSPLKENWAAMIFMLCLLLAAGVTASFVGYRVKKADWDRKAQLLAAYEALGGSFETLMAPSKTIMRPPLSPEQLTFVAAYQTNQRAREYGVFTIIQSSTREDLALAVSSLAEIGAVEASRTIEDTIRELDTSPNSDPKTNQAAQRYARQYGRPMGRETEAKLFRYLELNRGKIASTDREASALRE